MAWQLTNIMPVRKFCEAVSMNGFGVFNLPRFVDKKFGAAKKSDSESDDFGLKFFGQVRL